MSGTVTRFVPANLTERFEFSKLLATADMLPKAYRDKPGNVLLVMEYGDSLQIPYAQAISTISVIDGKPSASAALISALVRRAGHRMRVKGDDQRAWAQIVRADDPDFPYVSEWTVERAVRAGLCALKDGRPYSRSERGKPLPWETYTAAMLKARAITEVAREACQEALMGIQYTPEELGAVVTEDGTPVDDPRPARQAKRIQAEVVHVEPAAPARACGHPGDPSTRCGTCLAEEGNRRAAERAAEPAVTVQDEPEPPAEPSSPSDDDPVAALDLDRLDGQDWINVWTIRLHNACEALDMDEIRRLAQIATDYGKVAQVAQARQAWVDVAPKTRTGQ